MRPYILVLLLSLAATAYCQTLQRETCDPDRMMVDVDVAGADAVIGGLFEMRLPGGDGYGCGEPHAEIMLSYEAARWAIRRINNNNFIPGVRLGMKAYDTCYSPYRAVAATNQFYPQYSVSNMYCNETGKINLGIMGALTSWTTKPVAAMTSQFPASMISPAASTPELSDKGKYEYFMRTGLTSIQQIQGMMALMSRLGWKRVLLVYSDNDYGRDSMTEFVRQSQFSDNCIVQSIKLSPSGSLQDYIDILQDIGQLDATAAVYFGDHYSMKRVIDSMSYIADATDIQWIVSLANINDQFISPYMRGVIFVQPAFVKVTEFFDYFVRDLDENNPPAENPWYQDWFMSTFQCRLTGINYAPYNTYSSCNPKLEVAKRAAINMDYAFVDTVIKAVYAYAKALKTAQSNTCGQTGFCLGLQQMTPAQFNNYLRNVDFNFNEVSIPSLTNVQVGFDANGDFLTAGHKFWSFSDLTGSWQFNMVGSYDNGALNVDLGQIRMYDTTRQSQLPALPTSPCPPSGCSNCVVPRPMVQFRYMPGDVIIGGLFDLHRVGTETLTCGILRPRDALAAAAFGYALLTAKTVFTGILPGVDLGSFVIDMCDNAETGRLLLNNVLGGRHIVKDMYGRVIDPNQIVTVAGLLDSTEAISMATMLTEFKIPQLDSSATNVMLSNRDMFPYFNRVVPSDRNQLTAIVIALKRMGWSFIQVVHTASDYGRGGMRMLREIAARESICVAATHEIDGDNYAEVVQNLNNKPNARAVIGIVGPEDFRSILQQIQAQSMQGQFILTGTETWGTSSMIVNGLEDVAEGSISMEIIANPLTEFRNWVATLDPYSADVRQNMPSFIEWYQEAFDCYLDANNRGVYTSECGTSRPITSAADYDETAYVSFLISSTYAVARAIDATLKHYCGSPYDGVCWQFRSSPDLRLKILENIRNADFTFGGDSSFKMVNGEGVASYALYSYSNRQYNRIGTYNTETGMLDMVGSALGLPAGFTSQCADVCSECVYLLQHMPFTFAPGDIKVGVNLAIHNSSPDDPFQCTNMRMTNGFQSALAVMYALEMVNDNSPIGQVVSFGAVIFDHCNNPARAYGLPSALYSGLLESNGESPNLKTIRAWIADNSLVIEEMKEFFSDLNLPIISPLSTTNKFLDEDEYPTYIRTIQGDNTISTALAILVKSLALQYVTVVYSANSFGRGGMATFTSIARQEGVCIISTFEYTPNVNEDGLISELVSSPTDVVITFLGESDMDSFIEARYRNTDAQDKLVLVSPEPWQKLFYDKGIKASNILSLRMKSPMLQGYQEYLDSISYYDMMQHTFLAEYYMDLFQCNLPSHYRYAVDCDMNDFKKITSSTDYYQDNYVLSTINAVYAFTSAAHETLLIQCGEDYTSVCTKFYSDPDTNTILLTKLKDATFMDESGSRFSFIGGEGSTGREIMLFDGTQLTKIADFAGASIDFLEPQYYKLFEATQSSCIFPCTECIQTSLNFTYIPGDILLGGIFDVHEGALMPFSCGNINTLRGFQLLEAFHFALDRVNDKSGQFKDVLKNVKLGGVGLDSCQSSVRSGYMVSNIHNGLTVLERDGDTIEPDSMETYIASYSSDRSIYLARLMKSLKIPQIGYGSTSVELLDQDSYPYFLRTVPADDNQAKAMVKFLRKFDIRYVQVVHTADNYGDQGAKIFNKLAFEDKVCVAQMLSFPIRSDITQESANDIVLALLKKPVANTVVVFADTGFINEILQAVRRNPHALNKFTFIGSDTWANNFEATHGVEDIAIGSVTFDLDVEDIQEFDHYLATKTPANYPENPWFSEYYEEIHNCYLTIPQSRYPERCSPNPKNIITSKRYKQDTAIIHVINAVYAAAYGIDQALRQECGDDYTTVCEKYKNLEGRRDLILAKTKEQQFMDLTDQMFSFKDTRGDGNKGYVLYSIDASNVLATGHVYNPIGKFSANEVLTMTSADYSPSWDGSCDRVDSCTECPTIRNLRSRNWLLDNTNSIQNPNPATFVTSLAIHSQGVDEYRCGKMNVDQFLVALSIIYTLKVQIPVSLNTFNLRALILDNCNNELRIDQDIFNLLSTGTLCNSNFDSKGSIVDISTIAGVHTGGSRAVVAANRVTAPMKIQLVSSTASSTALSDTWQYPYFARTVPPDDVQMKLIASILKENDWSYFGVVYSDESYGISAFRELRRHINDKQLSCIGYAAQIHSTAPIEVLRPILRKMAEQDGIGVVVLLVTDINNLLKALIAENLQDKYLFIGPDTWANYQWITAGMSQQFKGAITIGFRDAFVNDFIDWVSRITYDNREGIPDDWFEEFYQHMHKCYLPDSDVIATEYSNLCIITKSFTRAQIDAQGIGLHAIAASYAVGTALGEFKKDYCGSGQSFSQCMETVDNSRDILFDETLKRTWKMHEKLSLTPAEKFDFELGDDRYWNVGYKIYNLMPNNTYDPIGSMIGDDLVFDQDKFETYKNDPVVSKCPENTFCDCNIITDAGSQQQVGPPKYMRDHEPRNYFVYDDDTGDKVYTWPIWAIAVAVLTSIGLLISIVLFCYFIVFYPIRGGTTILGFLMIIGLWGVYAINFAFFLPASDMTCAARKFCLGVFYTIVFAALLVKAVDNWRFKHSEYSTKRYRGLTNPFSLVLIALGIILIQCIIPIEWLILKAPTASLMSDSTNIHDWMWCDEHDFYDISMVLSMTFVIFLVILTAIFSALAWDSESNYYESRWIFVSCICTAGCFLVWMVVSTNAGPPYRDPALAIGNFLNATLILLCLPIRKLILMHRFQDEGEAGKVIAVDETGREMYSTVYDNQVYEPDVFQPDSKPNSDY